MTTRTDAGAKKSFVSALLPWIVAAAVAVIYLLTLNHWVSIKNLEPIARLTGRMWAPEVYNPCFTLVTSPFRWLPSGWVPLAINLFSAACAFFVLVLLARSVALLPQDRTRNQRERLHGSSFLSLPMSWIPIVLAVLICGLQLTFWENATALSNGMFDLLLFAYSVRCLLEYRVNKQESWILRAAVVYAAGMTDTWLMIGLFPYFLAAIIWIRGLSFFQLNFLSKLFLCIVAGLLVYLYLPLLHWHSDGFFWAPLQANLSAEFTEIAYVVKYTPHHVQLMLVITSLVPLFIIGIRWKSSFGDTSSTGILVANWVFHLVHFALLVLCVWAAFDTGFGLRDSIRRFPILYNNREQLLPLYFLSSLNIGYLSGYFLLVFRPITSRRAHQPATTAQKFLNKISIGFVCLLLVLVPIGLLYKNIPQIHVTNGPAIANYAALLTEHLPPQAVILSDNNSTLMLAQTWLARTRKDTNFVFLETHSLKSPQYYRQQLRGQPDLLPKNFLTLSNSLELSDAGALSMVITLSEKRPIYYLQPSFGYYFEAFYSVPHGMDYELKRYPTNAAVISPPPLSDAVFAENEAFWKDHDPQIRALLPVITVPVAEQDMTGRQKWMEAMQIPLEKSYDSADIAGIYSLALNTWGVQAQQMGKLEAAGAHFDEAAQLSPDNVVAKANSDFNKKLRKGERGTTEDPGAFEQRFGKFSNWEQILSLNGMFDEPTGCLAQGIVFARGKLDREAAQCFQRSLTLAPDSLLARLWLARVYVILGVIHKDFAAKALPLIDQLNARASSFADAAINPADIFQLELAANYINERPNAVRHLVNNAISRSPPDSIILNVAGQLSAFYHDYTNALLVTDRELELSPTNVPVLINKGYLQVQLKNFSGAIAPLSTALSLQPTNSEALFCRGMAYLNDEKLDQAQHDFETMQKLYPKASPAYRGLAQVATHRKDTNAAIHFYELALTNAVPNSTEALFVQDRIKKLKTGSP